MTNLQELRILTEQKINLATRIWNHNFSNIPVHTLSYTSKRIFGIYSPSRKVIEYNPFFMRTMPDHMRNTTVPHEVAHYITETIYPNAKQAHGPEFKFVASKLGLVKDNREDYSSLVATGHYMNYYCGCSYSASKVITRAQYKKIMGGSVRYSCQKCKEPIRV